MEAASTDERERLLDPVDRISEVLFGLIMAVTIVGSLSIATAGDAEVRTVLFAALGCNVAWGLVDAVMYVVRTATERARLHTLARGIREADAGAGVRLIAKALPDYLAPIVSPSDVEGMRTRLLARPASAGGLLRARDFLEAIGIFAMVVIGTFPVVAPFLFMDSIPGAMSASRVVTLVMLGVAGAALGRYAGYRRPWVTGASMALFGALLIVAVMALGG
jgi:VIT1/CCC1 family predicted Fe2+/Mn2+ transporter